MKKHTPWGTSQHSVKVAEGIESHSTAGHGGYWISRERLAGIHPAFVGFQSGYHDGNQWFEEDCEWCMVALSFPEEFTADLKNPKGALDAALSTLKSTYPAMYAKYLDFERYGKEAEWRKKTAGCLLAFALLFSLPALASGPDYVGIDHPFSQCLEQAETSEQRHLCEVRFPEIVVCIALADGSDQSIADCLQPN